jgi:hypothetical protein
MFFLEEKQMSTISGIKVSSLPVNLCFTLRLDALSLRLHIF